MACARSCACTTPRCTVPPLRSRLMCTRCYNSPTVTSLQPVPTFAPPASHARTAIMLGGEHTASLGGFRGVKRVFADAVILQVDAHLDMRPDYEGVALTHATWLHHVGQEFGFDIVHQVGLRSGDRHEWDTARHKTAWSSTELSLPATVRERIGHLPLYISVDIDV